MFDRRINIFKPKTVPNRLNEPKTEDELVYSKFPASKLDPGRDDPEKVENNAARSIQYISWELRYIPDLQLGPGWKIEDRRTGIFYRVSSESLELGRGQAILVRTELVK
jgi:hypothetical protein